MFAQEHFILLKCLSSRALMGHILLQSNLFKIFNFMFDVFELDFKRQLQANTTTKMLPYEHF